MGRIVRWTTSPKARKPPSSCGSISVSWEGLERADHEKHYGKDDLLGLLVLAVVNFPPRQIADFHSEVLTLGVVLGPGDVVLIAPDREVPLGGRIA